MRYGPIMAAVALAGAMAAGQAVAAIHGDYLEARTSDVYTGPCFANAEMNLAGKQAILAWRVREGAWNGVALGGLTVLAVVRASATLGDPYASPDPIRAVLVVDERATPRQREALVALARDLGGPLVAHAVAVETAPIRSEWGGAPGVASVTAGAIVEVRTRALCAHDHHCGNEEVYYPPLTDVPDALAAVAMVHAYRGPGLGGTWSSPGKRSAFVGTFAR